MARRNELIMASVFEDTKTLQIHLLWNRQEEVKARQVHGYGLSAVRFGNVIPL
jgi:hypothetical protein